MADVSYLLSNQQLVDVERNSSCANIDLDDVSLDADWLSTVVAMRLLLKTFANGMPSQEKALQVLARNILEGKVHQSFTTAADQLFLRGYLDRDQRIALSGAIGELLQAFGEKIEILGASGIVVDSGDAIDIANKEASGFVIFETTKEALPRWILISSSNRRDRDNQLVTEKGLQKAVTIADATGYRGPLRWWHTKEKGKVLDLGDCDFQMVYKGFLVESGSFRSRPIAEAVAKVAHLLRASIGFIHPKSEPVNGIFDNIAIYERSLLPKGAESNPFTSLMLA